MYVFLSQFCLHLILCSYAATDQFDIFRGEHITSDMKLMLEVRNTRHRGRSSIKIGTPFNEGGRLLVSRTASVCLHFRRVLYLEIEANNYRVRILRFPNCQAEGTLVVTNEKRLVFTCEHEHTEMEIKSARFSLS